ncbi:fibroblast growth factor 1 [Tribolium castaneum]|uniref:fibroblast growth factor 1 n=1 Tax=Tribolium castaneum TaxID=7070 RepID=UPI0001DCB4E1|nr:PREDICTED: fibroblast growth factor 1 [Tribolium castaneum]|eukprot:XP_008196985.1 PREDICTED: fibroblast growth factor 1 [Tribolium castaneum]
MENGTSDSDSTDVESLSDSDEIDEGKNVKNRTKRGIAWCGVEDAPSSHASISAPQISWPPSNPNSNWRQLRPVHFGNPLFGTKMQLYSRTRHNLAVYPDGEVRGTPDDDDLHTYLEVMSAGHPGHVRIKGLLTNLYVAMDPKGRLYGEPDMTDNSTIFIEAFQGSYNTYLSLKYAHLGWYIGIKKSGKFKRGPKTKYGQKAIKFLPRRSRFQ